MSGVFILVIACVDTRVYEIQRKKEPDWIAHHLDRYLTMCCHGDSVTFIRGLILQRRSTS